MQKTTVNPWRWQDQLGYAQAVEVPQSTFTLYCAGQAAMDAEGRPMGGSMSEQIKVSFDNLETVLQQAGYSMDHVVRLNFYTTSIEQFFAAYGQVLSRVSTLNGVPAGTLVEVKRLAFPELTVEIEATAVK
jgi:2-iminobutanoate/2-iminopropanoate deaminase